MVLHDQAWYAGAKELVISDKGFGDSSFSFILSGAVVCGCCFGEKCVLRLWAVNLH